MVGDARDYARIDLVTWVQLTDSLVQVGQSLTFFLVIVWLDHSQDLVLTAHQGRVHILNFEIVLAREALLRQNRGSRFILYQQFFWLLDLEVLEKVDKLSLVRLEVHLGRKLVNAELLDDLEDVELFIELFASASVQKVFSLALGPATTAYLLVKLHK